MKLTQVLTETQLLTLYKGISTFSGYANWPQHTPGQHGTTIPGFLSNFHLARVYSEPELTGPPDNPSIIAAVRINPQEVEDRTQAFIAYCKAQGQPLDVSLGFPRQWYTEGSIWTINCANSAHGVGMSCFGNADFVYCGVPKPYTVVRHYQNQAEWDQDA